MDPINSSEEFICSQAMDEIYCLIFSTLYQQFNVIKIQII